MVIFQVQVFMFLLYNSNVSKVALSIYCNNSQKTSSFAGAILRIDVTDPNFMLND
jgi:hypothetical protein